MSCLEKKREVMMPIKTLDILFRRRYVPNTQHYFTNRKHAFKENEEPVRRLKPFRVPRSEKLLSYIKYSDRKEKVIAKERLNRPLHLKDNLRMEAIRDISKRLYVEEPPDDVKAVVEIHPEFYSVIEGRPLRSFDDIKVYLSNIRNYAMNKQQIGYRRDLMLKIDKTRIEETTAYDKILDKYKQHVKHFQRFLTEDYKKACAKVTRAEKVYNDLVNKNIEFVGYVSKITLLNNEIFKLDSIRSILKIYRSYLLFVAPLTWRQKYDETLFDRVQSIMFESGVFKTDNDLAETLDIDKTVELAAAELSDMLPNHLYFTSPDQMIYLFRTMELQSGDYITQLSTAGPRYQMFSRRMSELKKATKQELDYFQYYIDNLNNAIKRESELMELLKSKFFRILNGCFYDSVASPETLKLKICIEYVYEQVLGKCEEGHQSLQDPMKILEVLYEDYNLRLDALDFQTVKQGISELFSQDLKMMKNAYKAERELREFQIMTNAMNKAFLPPAKYTRPVFEKKKKKKIVSKYVKTDDEPKYKTKKYKLTAEETEGLKLFTEWCEGMDPTPFLKEYSEYIKPTFNMQVLPSSSDFAI